MKIKKKQLVYLLISLIVVIALPILFTTDYNMLVINRLLVYIVMVFGLNFITGRTGQMNLGSAGIMAMGAYASSLVTVIPSVSPWVGLLLAIVICLIIGVVLGHPSLRV